MSTPRNPAFAEILAASPGTIADFKSAAPGGGAGLVDLGVGDPRIRVGEGLVRTLAAGVPPVSEYPLAVGTPEARAAVAAWARRRHGVDVDPDTEVIPTHGSKEAIASFTQLVASTGETPATRPLVAVTTPGYPTPAHAARLVGAGVVELEIDPGNGFVPDLDSVGAHVWERVAVLWLNYPNNPTAAVAPPRLYAHAAELASRHGFVLASDEAYAEVYAGAAPVSALEVADRANVVVFTSLSKRSGLTGFRCGAVIGPAEIVADFKRLRAMLGLAPQVFTQHLAAAAWADDAAAEALRVSLMGRARVLLDAVRAAGADAYGGAATPFVWMRVPPGESDVSLCRRLVAAGVVVTPGSFFGGAGSGFVRLAAMAPAADCELAAELLREIL